MYNNDHVLQCLFQRKHLSDFRSRTFRYEGIFLFHQTFKMQGCI